MQLLLIWLIVLILLKIKKISTLSLGRLIKTMIKDGIRRSLSKVRDKIKGVGFKEHGVEVSDKELNEIFTKLDVDNSGSIGYTEYLAGAADLCIINDEKYIKAAFDFFDKQNKGALDKKEISEGLGKGWISETDLIELFKEIDTNKDGKISYSEFKTMMKEMATKKKLNIH